MGLISNCECVMYLMKLSALTSVLWFILVAVLELYFGLTTAPYGFGFPRWKWPMLLFLGVTWIASFGLAYWLLFGRRTFYG